LGRERSNWSGSAAWSMRIVVVAVMVWPFSLAVQ
jgi:hypothetical protein